MRTLYIVLDIQRTLGGLEHAVEALEATTTSHGEKLEKRHYQLSILENAVARHEDSIHGLEKFSRFAGLIGAILIGGGLVYLGRLLLLFFSK